MNKKGQTLVIFVLLLPIIFVFLGISIDFGNSLIIKRKNENTLHDILIYTLKDDEFNEEKFKKNLEKNLEYESIKIVNEGNILDVKVVTKYKGIFTKIFKLGFDEIDINIKYDLINKRIIRKWIYGT